METERFLKDLIKMGEGDFGNERFIRNEVMKIIHSDDFYFKIRDLDKDDFIKLIKGVCILEGLPDMQFGSTTRIPKILNLLSKKYAIDKQDLINWLFSNRSNPYIPYGNHVSLEIKSESAYEEYQKQRELYKRSMIEQDKKRHEEAKARKKKKYEEHLARSKANRKKYYESKSNNEAK
jgi:hypothetical protein